MSCLFIWYVYWADVYESLYSGFISLPESHERPEWLERPDEHLCGVLGRAVYIPGVEVSVRCRSHIASHLTDPTPKAGGNSRIIDYNIKKNKKYRFHGDISQFNLTQNFVLRKVFLISYNLLYTLKSVFDNAPNKIMF